MLEKGKTWLVCSTWTRDDICCSHREWGRVGAVDGPVGAVRNSHGLAPELVVPGLVVHARLPIHAVLNVPHPVLVASQGGAKHIFKQLILVHLTLVWARKLIKATFACSRSPCSPWRIWPFLWGRECFVLIHIKKLARKSKLRGTLALIYKNNFYKNKGSNRLKFKKIFRIAWGSKSQQNKKTALLKWI